uniref:Uncharacterized protein n=1 Tax=Anguilla anguilla TaxID=7936 RepID=A0A0E9WD45_ANGAN
MCCRCACRKLIQFNQSLVKHSFVRFCCLYQFLLLC